MGDTRVRGERLTREERLAVRRLISGGCSFEDAARAVRCSTKTVQRLLNAVGGMPPQVPRRLTRQLSLAEREEVSRGLEGGASYRAIARRLGRAPSTVCREVNGNGGPYRYRACRADEAAYTRARRPKDTKCRQCPRLRTQVESLLHARWSPQQISARLGVDHPHDPEMRVSHETIYRSLFVQMRGALRKELTACLRSGRTRRRPHGRKDPGGYIKGMVLIADRPADVADRAVPGHWEGDLMLGVRGESAIATLVERQTRYVMLLAVGRDRTSARVCALLAKKIRHRPHPALCVRIQVRAARRQSHGRHATVRECGTPGSCRAHDVRNPRESRAPELLADVSQGPAFAVGELLAVRNLCPEDAILRDEILVAPETLFVDRACDVHQHGLPIHCRSRILGLVRERPSVPNGLDWPMQARPVTRIMLYQNTLGLFDRTGSPCGASVGWSLEASSAARTVRSNAPGPNGFSSSTSSWMFTPCSAALATP